ncbi:MAG TPA: hypothetical protein VEV82_05860, partial [Actinomycetota bacterium]|nr:hypothetical protein [Actinomycetota bacterium]
DVEPNNSMAVNSADETPISALYVEGDFSVLGPMTPEGEKIKVEYVAGRIVFGESGKTLLHQLWRTRRAAVPPFRSELDD